MPQVVITGAGPIGLHLALLFVKNKLPAKEILIIDPRAGHYTRPGHINDFVFETVYDTLGIDNGPYKTGHIKDIERQLFELVQEKGIPVLKESFLDIIPANDINGKEKAILVSNGPEQTQVIACEYLFDCTGGNRQVVKAVNSYCEGKSIDAPFALKAYTEVAVKRHFLAYVKMSESDCDLVQFINRQAQFLDPEKLLQNLQKLQTLGWKHFDLPIIYGSNFGKGKMCIYTEMPDDLPEGKELEWVQAALVTATGSDTIKFTCLPPSLKWGKKPRLQAFTVNPHGIDNLGCEIAGLPTIGVSGDACDEPNYYLAHGIRGGAKRNAAMVASMLIFDGRIMWFDIDDYQAAVKELRQQHKQRIIAHYEERHEEFDEALDKVKFCISLLINSQPSSLDQEQLLALKKEVDTRIMVVKAIKSLNKSLNKLHQIEVMKDGNFAKKDAILNAQLQLTTALSALPGSDSDHQRAKDHLLLLINAWKDAGNQAFRMRKYAKAKSAYQNAIEDLSHLPDSNDKNLFLTLHSNLLLCHRNLNEPNDAYELGWQIINTYGEDLDINPTLLNKIKYNTILSLFTLCSKTKR